MKCIIAVVVIVLLSLTNRATAATIAGVPGNAILARSSGEALIIWDASPLVASVVRDHVSDAMANDLIARGALKIFSQMHPSIDRAARSITVRVVYQKSGDISPTYGTATFDGVERYEELTAKPGDVSGDAGRWRELGSRERLPPWLQSRILGALPPR